MTAFDFIYKELSKLSKDFPRVNIKYGYNEIIKTHIVELSPEVEYQFNHRLDDAWIPVSFNFKVAFPDEEIAFIPPSSSLSLKEPQFELNPIIFGELMSNFYAEFSEKEFKYSFPTSIISGTLINNSFVRVLEYPTQIIDVEHIENIYQSAA